MVPHAALHAVGQQNKRLKARIAELEAQLSQVQMAAPCANVDVLSLQNDEEHAEAERNGLTRSTGETGGGQCGDRAAGPIHSPLRAGLKNGPPSHV